MIRIPFSCALVFILSGCERSPYAGYKVVGDDVHLHLHTIGDGDVLASDSDSVRVRFRMGLRGQDIGGVFSTEQTYLVKDIRLGALIPVLRRLHVGDSLSVIAPAHAFPWGVLARGTDATLPDTGSVQAEIAMLELRTPAIIRAEAERFKRNDPLGYEQRLIAGYMKQNTKSYVRWGTSDLHHSITGHAMDTAAVQLGDQITISYEGRRLEDGLVFDDTDRNGAALSFNYGDKDQVINGLEVAVKLLREGQEGTFIFPSAYAFGAKGIPGVLDPYMPVEYSVKMERVERKALP
jgi:FKBP-type peptidyl-prolyl cis-trans isomerase